MKALKILSLFLLFGCAPSTQDLIEQAHLTGDWTLVNKRLDAVERRNAERAPACPRGGTLYCSKSFGDEKCGCVRSSEVREMLNALGL